MGKTYLGDGLYASYDGMMVALSAGEGPEQQTVYLEPNVLDEFFKFVEREFKLKIEIKKARE